MSSNFSAMTLPPTTSTNTTATTVNFVAIASNTEYSYNLPSNCKKFYIQSRITDATLKIAYAPLQSGVTYTTVWPGCGFLDTNFYSSQTIYFQSSVGSNTIEIVAYV